MKKPLNLAQNETRETLGEESWQADAQTRGQVARDAANAGIQLSATEIGMIREGGKPDMAKREAGSADGTNKVVAGCVVSRS